MFALYSEGGKCLSGTKHRYFEKIVRNQLLVNLKEVSNSPSDQISIQKVGLGFFV